MRKFENSYTKVVHRLSILTCDQFHRQQFASVDTYTTFQCCGIAYLQHGHSSKRRNYDVTVTKHLFPFSLRRTISAYYYYYYLHSVL